MAISIKHKFTSALPDSTDTSLIRPSNWNDTHDIVMATASLLGRITAGTGAAEEISVAAPLLLSGTSLSMSYTPVDKAGDTMGGDLVFPTNLGPRLNSTGGAGARRVKVTTDNLSRWQFGGDGTAEAGSNAGSNFVVNAHDDTGAFLSTPINIIRSTGQVNIQNFNVSTTFTTTANMAMNKTFPTIQLNKTANTQSSSIAGQLNGLNLWNLVLGTGTAAGDLQFNAYDDAGAFLGVRFSINRLTGQASILNGLSSDLSIAKSSPIITLDKQNTAQNNSIIGSAAGSKLWDMRMGASNGDFLLHAYDDAGAFLLTRLNISRLTGDTALTGSLIITGRTNPAISLRKTATTENSALNFQRSDGTANWIFTHMSDSDSPPNGIGIKRRNTSGGAIDTPFSVADTDGAVSMGTPSVPTIIRGGLQYTKGMALASATDADTLTVAGVYDGASMTNMPYSSSGRWRVSVEQSSQTTNDIEQFARRIALPTAYAPSGVWTRSRHSGTWTAWEPLGGWMTPEHFAAAGDGLVDDVSAVTNALRSGFPVLLRRLYRITAQITCGVGLNTAGDGTVAIYGMGGKHLYLDGTAAAITFTAGTTSGTYGAPQFIMRDVIINCPRTDHTRGAITINGTGGSGSVSKNFDIHNVQIYGTSTTTSTLYGIVLNNARNGHIKNCVYQGKRSEAAGSRTCKGIVILGDSDPVAHRIEACNIYFVSRAVEITGTPEGIQIIDPEFVAVDYGVDWVSDENPISGDNSGKQMLIVTGGHINFVNYGVRVIRGWDWQVTNVTFLFSVANSNGICIYGEMQAANDQQAWIDGCKFQDKTTGAVSTGTTIGISLQGHTSGVLRSRIGMNWYVLLDHGIYLGTNAKEVRYQSAGVWTACTANVTNTGGGTNTAY